MLAALTAVAVAGPAAAATDADFAKLRQCESGGNYSIDTGNGFYGAYQFDAGTWHALGYGGLPSQAAPAAQDAAAHRLYAERGWAPWPSCSRSLGLAGGPYAGSSAPAPAPVVSNAQAAPAPQAGPAPAVVPAALTNAVPATLDDLLSLHFATTPRADVRTWQALMAARGYVLPVDGEFGTASARAAAADELVRAVLYNSAGAAGASTWAADLTQPLATTAS